MSQVSARRPRSPPGAAGPRSAVSSLRRAGRRPAPRAPAGARAGGGPSSGEPQRQDQCLGVGGGKRWVEGWEQAGRGEGRGGQSRVQSRPRRAWGGPARPELRVPGRSGAAGSARCCGGCGSCVCPWVRVRVHRLRCEGEVPSPHPEPRRGQSRREGSSRTLPQTSQKLFQARGWLWGRCSELGVPRASVSPPVKAGELAGDAVRLPGAWRKGQTILLGTAGQGFSFLLVITIVIMKPSLRTPWDR